MEVRHFPGHIGHGFILFDKEEIAISNNIAYSGHVTPPDGWVEEYHTRPCINS
jgi:hypothetical protein